MRWYSNRLGEIAAQGNSPVRRSYNYIDNAIQDYINYYRLKIVDMNGNYTQSKIILVAATTGYEIVVSPNPVKDELFINLPIRFQKSVMKNIALTKIYLADFLIAFSKSSYCST